MHTHLVVSKYEISTAKQVILKEIVFLSIVAVDNIK
jgi:hypothetical protein